MEPTAQEKSPADITAQPDPKPAPPAKPAPAKPASPPKDEKWLETEISRAEDELHKLRELKKTGGKSAKPAPAPARPSWGTVIDEA